jgi:hypothetical protein
MEPRENNMGAGADEWEAARAEGTRWLELIGEGHVVGTSIPYTKDGRQLNAEDFPLLCGNHVRPVFTALEKLDESDPRRQGYIDSIKRTLHTFLSESAEA